jgi:glycosyltransferase involved in cell wall biosynthesis
MPASKCTTSVHLIRLKKVLILTYYWPPSGGAGVQRWLKFAKYLREFGYEPIIYTADQAEYPVLDSSLEKDIPQGLLIIKTPVWEPYKLYKAFTGQKKNERVVSGFLQEKASRKQWTRQLSLWLRANIFIPDARCFWIKPSVKFLHKWLQDNPVDLLVSTGPPHSMHVIALRLKRKLRIPWLADFRDPWTNIDFAADLPMSTYAQKRNASLEQQVLRYADCVTVVSDLMREEFSVAGRPPAQVVTNGFDPDDFQIPDEKLKHDGMFSIVHTGSMNTRRNHPVLWQVLGKICRENPSFNERLKIKLIGKNDFSVMDQIKQVGLECKTEQIDYLPHEEIIAEQKSAALLLLAINNYGDQEKGFFSPKATLTGKLFEYLASGRPILMIGPKDSQAAEIIRNCKAGDIAGFEDLQTMETILKAWFELFQRNELTISSQGVEVYSRKELTRKMSVLFNQILNQSSASGNTA